MSTAYGCPNCASVETSVFGEPEFVESGMYLDHYVCTACGCKWDNTFTYSSKQILEQGRPVLDGLNDVSHNLIIVKFEGDLEGTHYTVYNGALESEVAAEDMRNWSAEGCKATRFNVEAAIKLHSVEVVV